jgi:hypothetical protein
VDGTQKSFEENVTPRMNKKKAILTAFSKRFKSVPDSVKDSHYVKLAADLMEPISMATADCVLKAEERVRNIKNIALENRKFPEINNNSSSFTVTADAGFISQYLRLICNLEIACADIYEPIKQKYRNICLEIYVSFTEVLDKVKALEGKNLEAINTYTNDLLDKYVEKSTKKIRALPATCLLEKDDDIIRRLFNGTVFEHTRTAEEMNKRYNITGDLSQNSMAKFYCDEIGFLRTEMIGTAAFESYDNTKICYSRFTNTLKKLNNSLADVVVDHKKSLLFGKYMHEYNDRTILLSNPRIDFMKSDLVNDRMLCEKAFMTVETYDKNYAPFLKEAVESLEEKGYISKDMFVINVLRIENNFTNYDVVYNGDCSDVHFNNLIHLLGRRVMKIYCKEFVKGTTFAVELNPSTANKILSKKPDEIRKW